MEFIHNNEIFVDVDTHTRSWVTPSKTTTNYSMKYPENCCVLCLFFFLAFLFFFEMKKFAQKVNRRNVRYVMNIIFPASIKVSGMMTIGEVYNIRRTLTFIYRADNAAVS